MNNAEEKWLYRLGAYSTSELESALIFYNARIDNPETSGALRDAARDAVTTIVKMLEQRRQRR